MKQKILLVIICILNFCAIAQASNNTLKVDIRLKYVNNHTFKLTFNEDINLAGANDNVNYQLAGTGGLIGHPDSVSANGAEVLLFLKDTITTLAANQSVEVRVNNVIALSGNSLNPNHNSAKYFVWHFTEDISKAVLETAYTSNSYIGNHGLLWSFALCAIDEDYDQGIVLRYSKEASDKESFISSSAIKNGIGALSFNYYKVWKKNDPRSFQITVNDFEHTISNLIVDGTPSVNEFYEKTNLNISGEVDLKIENVSATNREVAVDNISWTSYASAQPVKLYPLTENKLKLEFNQLIDSTSVTSENFNLSIGNAPQNLTSVEYQAGNEVLLTFDGALGNFANNDTVKVIVNNVVNLVNSLVTNREEIHFIIEKPVVKEALTYVDFTTVRLEFFAAVDSSLAVDANNYVLSGTGGATGQPSTVALENEKSVLLTVPSTEDYSDGMTISVTVSNITDLSGIFAVAAPENVASMIVDRTAPELLVDLEFVDMETVVVHFSEALILSDSLKDFTIKIGNDTIVNPLSIDLFSDTALEIRLFDFTSFFIADDTIEVSIKNATDIAGNPLVAKSAIYKMNTDAPIFEIASITNILHRSATVHIQINRASTIYWSVYDQSVSTVSADEIINEEGDVNNIIYTVFGQNEVDFSLSELIWNTEYNLFCVAESREGILSEVKSSILTTSGSEQAFGEEELGDYKSYAVTMKNGRITVKKIDASENTSVSSINVYDINGRTAYTGQLSANMLVLPALSRGIYIVSINDGENLENHKIVISK